MALCGERKPNGSIETWIKRGQVFTLRATTLRGKTKLATVRNCLAGWQGRRVVEEERLLVAFAPGVRGPWLLLRPEHPAELRTEPLSSWVHKDGDADFVAVAAKPARRCFPLGAPPAGTMMQAHTPSPSNLPLAAVPADEPVCSDPQETTRHGL